MNVDAPCDPSKAIYPEQMNDLLNPGDLAVEIGWCSLPNGAGFVAVRHVYPDITAEMIDWWFAWFPLEDLALPAVVSTGTRRHYGEP